MVSDLIMVNDLIMVSDLNLSYPANTYASDQVYQIISRIRSLCYSGIRVVDLR